MFGIDSWENFAYGPCPFEISGLIVISSNKFFGLKNPPYLTDFSPYLALCLFSPTTCFNDLQPEPGIDL